MGIDLTSEPEIIINGIKLTGLQAMTVRVAVGIMMIECQGEGTLARDETGPMYLEQLVLVNHIMALNHG